MTLHLKHCLGASASYKLQQIWQRVNVVVDLFQRFNMFFIRLAGYDTCWGYVIVAEW